MEWTDTALVLHVGRFREADLWVRLLALEQGLVTAFAFGGSRSRRRFTGCLDVFNVIRARVTASRDGQFLNMQESTLLEGPERLRRDWRRQGMAANCVRFMEALGVPPDASPFSFSLLRELLGLLENEERPPELAPLFFRFRLAATPGSSPVPLPPSKDGRSPLVPLWRSGAGLLSGNSGWRRSRGTPRICAAASAAENRWIHSREHMFSWGRGWHAAPTAVRAEG